MSGGNPGPRTTGRDTIRGVLGIATGRAEALRFFGDTPQAFIASLVPLIVIPVLNTLLVHRAGGGRLLLEILASVSALLAPPVFTHALARQWGREALWLRYAVAFNWCQFGLLMLLLFVLFVIGGIGGRGGVFMIIVMMGCYALWLHWFLGRKALAISGGQAAGLVAGVHLVTLLVVTVPRFVGAFLRA